MDNFGIERIDRGDGSKGSGDSAFRFTGKINDALTIFLNLIVELQDVKANQGVGYEGTLSDLKVLVDNLTQLVASDDVSLDELQEVVTFIKANREDLQNLSINNIAGLEDALASKTNVQPDLNQTDDTQSDYVKGVDDLKEDYTSLGRMMSTGFVDERYRVGAFQNLSDLGFNSAIEDANIFDHISSPSYVAFRKSFHDNLGTPLPFVKGVKGVYRFSIQITNGSIFSFEIDTEKSNPFSESANNDFYIYESNILLINGNSGLFNDSNVSFVSSELLQASTNATVINSLDEISEAGSYLLKNTDNTPTNAYDLKTGEQKLLSDFISIDFNGEIFDEKLNTQYIKIESEIIDQYDEIKYFRLNGGNPGEEVTRTALNGTGYTANLIASENNGLVSIEVLTGRDNYDVSNIFAPSDRRVNIVTPDGFVRRYDVVNGERVWITEWLPYEEVYSRGDFKLNMNLYTEDNVLIGTFFNNRQNHNGLISVDNTIELSREFFFNSINGSLITLGRRTDNVNDERFISNIKLTQTFLESNYFENALILNIPDIELNGVTYNLTDFDINDTVRLKAHTGQGISNIPVTFGVNENEDIYLNDITGTISQTLQASSYSIEIEVKKIKKVPSILSIKTTPKYHVGKNVLLIDPAVGDSNSDHNVFMTGVFNATHPTHNFNFLEANLDNDKIYPEAKKIDAQIVFRAVFSQSRDSRFFNADIPYISAHHDNEGDFDNALNDDNIDFYENAILVRGGVLGEDATTATSSYGKGVEFVQPSRRDDLDADLVARIDANLTGLDNQLGNNEHPQSPATAIFAGKFKAILDATKAPWKIVRKAARLSADKATPNAEWNEFDGFGILNVDACIALIEQWKIDGLNRDIADTTEKRLHVPEILEYDDLYPNTAVPKRHIDEKITYDILHTTADRNVDVSFEDLVFTISTANRNNITVRTTGSSKTATVTSLYIGFTGDSLHAPFHSNNFAIDNVNRTIQNAFNIATFNGAQRAYISFDGKTYSIEVRITGNPNNIFIIQRLK